ncbi:putative elongation of fatty acids protein DDB_G0272012 [Chenopodium quinoa]|uniref:very-long-chain 3-oxoacyl-CoA synthase n=1 Tax=Chenopodium quinoa TaxID=63459 RepID=A0A803LQU2_CHEQI|nr:putative elongation of fatty acids protein DDB_G0272012 [Chenopodium quinoa]
METVIKTAKNWLVYHPTIHNFEWKTGTTNGASLQFLILTVVSYISLTLLLSRYSFRPVSLPLRSISIVYNLFSFSLSLLMAVGCGLSTLSQMPNPDWIFCFPANHTPTRGPVFFWGYVFYLSKILEFTDTLLILLNGNSTRRRLSFLHVFHHSMVLIMCYIWIDAAQSLFPLGVVTNASVHTVMYGYYLMCSLGVRPSWKRMVTNIQIIQFIFGFFAAGVALYYHLVKYPCSGPKYAWSFGVVFNTSLLYLFVDFYSKSYKNKKE